MARVHLPVLDRRFVLRGMAAALVAGLAGCRIALEDPESRDVGADPDAGTGTPPVQGGDPAVARCGDGLCIDLAHPDNAALLNVDGAKLIVFENRRMLVIRTSDDTFITLSAVCTHSGCTVRFSAAREQIECPCHGSTFALDGAVTHGPAASPLAQFATTLDAAARVVTVTLG
jgi:Rieske Fe-S protein